MTTRAADEMLLGFGRALADAGLRVTADRGRTMLSAVAAVGLDDPRATYWAARAATCASPDDLDVYDDVFRVWFSSAPPRRSSGRRSVALEAPVAGGDEAGASALRAAASDVEVLRHRDVAAASADDRARLFALVRGLRPVLPRRPAYRRVPWRRGTVDRARTLRRMLAALGEPAELAVAHRASRPRRVVLLVDVSGSMTAYADALLRLAHVVTRADPRHVEVFTVGTRLTRVTRAMRGRDPAQAVADAGATVPDWAGGTRLGETLKAFLDRWGQRGLARGATVVVFSDGWERGDAGLLAAQLGRLARLAHRVVWVNPHQGRAGYLPVQQGIAAAVPHVDRFVSGHSLAAFEELLEVLADA